MTTHHLKTHPEPFAALVAGTKTCEFRLNDRDYQVGDELELEEWKPDDECYTGAKLERVVTHVLRGPAFGVAAGYACLSIGPVPKVQAPGSPTDWDGRFIELARTISTWSKDPSTKMGCVVVGAQREILSVGYNGFPRGVADDGRLEDRDQKYPLIVHAEENAVLNATRTGSRIAGGISYALWPPCTRCARMFVQAGISEVVHPTCQIPERWIADFDTAAAMLREAGVTLRFYTKPRA